MSDPKKTLRVLLVEDSPEDTELLIRELRRAGYTPSWERVETRPDLERALAGAPWDLVLCDSSMPTLSRHDALEIVRKARPQLPLIFHSAVGRASAPTEAAGSVEKGAPGALLALIGKVLSGKKTAPAGQGTPLQAELPARRPRILMVDDQVENLVALEAALSGLDADLVRAHSGPEALGRLLEEDYAVILLDVRMPEMSGLETAEILRKRQKTRLVPVIFMTAALDNPADVARGYATGGVDYLQKPFIPEILRAKVDVFLELSKKTMLLETQAADLRTANEGLEAFSRSAAHDLRAPLRAIDGFSRILAEDYSGKTLDPAGLDLLERIRRAAGRMENLIRDLLAFAHLNRMDLARSSVDLTGLVDEILAALSGDIRASGASVTVERPLGTVLAHAPTLRQGVENLVTNALKFTAEGKSPEIRIRSELRAPRRRLWVEDHGIGISRRDEARLFLAFSRLDSAKGFPGTGLGLAIVKRAVERMGGEVGVESEAGKGSRFFVELPCG